MARIRKVQKGSIPNLLRQVSCRLGSDVAVPRRYHERSSLVPPLTRLFRESNASNSKYWSATPLTKEPNLVILCRPVPEAAGVFLNSNLSAKLSPRLEFAGSMEVKKQQSCKCSTEPVKVGRYSTSQTNRGMSFNES